MGCSLIITRDSDKIVVQGNACKRGEVYAIEETTNPSRTVTSTMRVHNGVKQLVPVKTANPIPKDKIKECMKEIKSITIEAPISYYQVLIENVAQTQINIISVKQVDKAVTEKP
jgi:CxxC motif-containing protein